MRYFSIRQLLYYVQVCDAKSLNAYDGTFSLFLYTNVNYLYRLGECPRNQIARVRASVRARQRSWSPT